ncbi:MAG TPA: aquaporin [Alphaproteobacteria bacterium]|nr:aquaporin [Alphaproteobacteria bacterium]
MTPSLPRRVAAEVVGTTFLLAAVVGSGIMAERLAAGNMAVALLANAIATGCALFALILTFAPVSGAHFNPVVSLARTLAGEMPGHALLPFIAAQIAGAIAGVWIAHLMFGLPILQASVHARDGIGQWAGEFVATFGLVLLIESGVRSFPERLPAAVAAYITAAYWFTSSTSFANPAVTIARALTDTFAGISPAHVPAFIASQLLGALAAIAFCRWLTADAWLKSP